MQIPQPGGTLGHYRIERMIGQGGMGVVYAATDLRLGREVALKVITGPLASTEEYRRRFHHEALAMSRVQSPWIVQIHDHDEVDGFPYIVTQFIVGTDLGSLVADEGRLTAKRALRLCAQLARGLDDAHRAGVLHRDVKPGNVLLAEPGTSREHAYLCDFGIAVSDAASHHTATGMVAGTWAYLAPERTLGSSAAPASDLYAVGCVLWKCLTGQEPFTGTPVEMAIAHANAPTPQLTGSDDFTQGLNRLFTRVLAKVPAERHADGAALAADLEQLAAAAPDARVSAASTDAAVTVTRDAVPTTAPPPPPPPSPAPASGSHAAPTVGPTAAPAAPRRRRPWPLIVGGVVLIALLGGAATWAGLAARDDGEPTAEPDPEVPELVSGDIDGDGLGDVVAQARLEQFEPLNTSSGTLWQLLSTSTTLGPATELGSESGAPLLGDVDGDGRMDQVWFSTPGAEVLSGRAATYEVRVITGTGEIWRHTQQLTAIEKWETLQPYLADVDDDGRDDLLFSNEYLDFNDDDNYDNDTFVTVHASLAGDRSFGEPEQVLDLGQTDDPITGVGDFDGDGDDDLFRASNTHRRNTITGVEVQPFRNDDGTYTAEEPTRLETDTWGVGWFVAGDPEGDGDDELVVTNGRGGAVGVIEYDDGAFGRDVAEWLAPDIPEKDWEEHVFDNGAPSFEHTLSDVNGDGADDLVATAHRSDGLAIGVALSDGSSFARFDQKGWGIIPCSGDACAALTLVANVQPAIL
ncbi:serine/threonine protein kinase [Nocardioides immobilis]|uniref:non-specific serine/threonine protein kinase n=1 Tax=Nocardioides immobilis TaxID=2049295 RepID=A0A417Y4I3_9ACTN|nr:serine/threonine-protein kinase [Nocardioides immobilis]RHW27461.1 serine/threonine protein kinase [Nocardioides immobilis]